LAASLQDLKDRARELGVPGSLIRSNLHDRDQLQSIIDSFEKGKEGAKKMAKPVAKAKAKAKAGRPSSRAPRKAAVATPVKRGRGRPKGSVNKKRSTPVAAKKTPTRKVRSVSNGDAGRNILGKLKFSNRDGWNPREGSATDEIFKALVKTKGDRHAAYDLLKGRVSSIIPKKKRGGGTRDKAEQLEMLMYRIHRTLFDFAVQTGQHEKSENRVEYGTGGTGRNGSRSKPAARKAVSKAKAKPAVKRGRPASAKAGAKRGRPVKAKARR
jgi:hypothetical protein